MLYRAIKSGTARNDAERDRGTIVHLVETNSYPSWDKALCGVKPGARGNGWYYPTYERSNKGEVTCPECLEKQLLAKEEPMSKELVVHPGKVAFGTPEFMWVRREIDRMCEQRRLLRLYFRDNEDIHRSLTQMIRNMADLVYFKPKTFRRPEIVMPPFIPPPKHIKPEKKGKKKAPVKSHPTLF